MADRTFKDTLKFRCKKVFWEDYTSSSDNDDFWGRDVDCVLSD